MKQSQTNMKGFSLMELVVAIGVLGILLGASVPAMSRFVRSSRLAGATNTMMADLHKTHALAVMQRKQYEITFASNKYAIVKSSPRETLVTRAMPKGVTCTATDTATFYAWGLTAPMSITMTGTGATRTLQVAANGGVTR